MNKTQVTFRVDADIYKEYKKWCIDAGTTPTSDLNRYMKNIIGTNTSHDLKELTKVITKAEWDNLFLRLKNKEGSDQID